MDELISERLQSFMDRWVSPLPELLQEIEAFTLANHPEAHMLSGAQQGQFLSMISQMIRPRRVLEIGTFTGYSALCLASGLTEFGKLSPSSTENRMHCRQKAISIDLLTAIRFNFCKGMPARFCPRSRKSGIWFSSMRIRQVTPTILTSCCRRSDETVLS